jgi:membrane protease YdiL (CAAX protease family)
MTSRPPDSSSDSLLSSAPLLIHYRNLIHAPITEEIAFRSLMILVLTSVSCFPSDPAPNEDPSSCLTNVALVTPAWFAVAHAHHLLEKLFVSKMPLTSALLSTVIQLTYTSIFGLIASYLFVSTGNLASPIVSHIVCNFFGLPDLGFLTPPRTQNSSSISYLHPWRHALLFLHALGLGLFSLLLLGSSSSVRGCPKP